MRIYGIMDETIRWGYDVLKTSLDIHSYLCYVKKYVAYLLGAQVGNYLDFITMPYILFCHRKIYLRWQTFLWRMSDVNTHTPSWSNNTTSIKILQFSIAYHQGWKYVFMDFNLHIILDFVVVFAFNMYSILVYTNHFYLWPYMEKNTQIQF